jgi:hypothetical protein
MQIMVLLFYCAASSLLSERAISHNEIEICHQNCACDSRNKAIYICKKAKDVEECKVLVNNRIKKVRF